MKVLYIASRWPWPVSLGRQRMIDQTLKLASEFAEVHLLAFDAEGSGDAPVKPFVRSAKELRRPGFAGVLRNLLLNPLRPLQCHLFNSASARKEISAAIDRVQPDVVVIDMLRLFGLAKHAKRHAPGARLVLDMDDLLSVRYARMLENNKLDEITGTFAKKIPGPLRRLAKWAPRILVGFERKRMVRLERAGTALFDSILMVSPVEADALNATSSNRKAHAFPPLIDRRELVARDYATSIRFVFVGNGTYAPNGEALRLLNRVAGRVTGEAAGNDVAVRFETAGVVNPNLTLNHLHQNGFVDDLGAFLGGDAVLVAPILSGTGIKTKIIDALEFGVPVITTPIGAEGLPLTPGKHFISVADEDELAAAITRLVRTPDARARLADMGRAALDCATQTNNRPTLLAVLRDVMTGDRTGRAMAQSDAPGPQAAMAAASRSIQS